MNRIKIHFLVVLTLTLTLFTSCKDSLKITGKAQPSAVVYAILDPSETVHFIKVNKAYVTSDNNIETAAIADSNYFSSVTGTVKEYYNGTLKRTFNLTDTLIENKAAGVFYYPQQKVYMFKTPQNNPLVDQAGYEYKLELDINNGEFTINSSTEIVRDVKITNPAAGAFNSYSFANNPSNATKYKGTSVTGDFGTGSMFDLTLRITIAEYTSNTDSTFKSFDWQIKTGDLASLSNSVLPASTADGETFYKLVRDNVSNNSNIIKRNLISIDAILTSGSKVLFDYIALSKPSSSLAQNKITYTNLTATNNRKVLGIFTSRTTVIVSKVENIIPGTQARAIDLNSMRELCKGQYTGTLLFCSPNTIYQAESFFCN